MPKFSGKRKSRWETVNQQRPFLEEEKGLRGEQEGGADLWVSEIEDGVSSKDSEHWKEV